MQRQSFRDSPDFQAWGFVDAADSASAPALAALASRLSAFYAQQAQAAKYWEYADQANAKWLPETHPFHCHLARLIEPGAKVVDFGCGSAHAASNLQPGIEYVGIEGSAEQVAINRERFPQHRFISGDMLASHGLEQTADWALSFFAIEHCARPDVLLQRMVDTLKPDGHLAILCPNFGGRMMSIRAGWSALSKRDKVRRLKLLDAAVSYIQERWIMPARVARVHRSSMRFPIYLRPRCFDAPWFSDSDAVYLVKEDRLRDALLSLGCSVRYSTRSVADTHGVEKSVIYIVARKPV